MSNDGGGPRVVSMESKDVDEVAAELARGVAVILGHIKDSGSRVTAFAVTVVSDDGETSDAWDMMDEGKSRLKAPLDLTLLGAMELTRRRIADGRMDTSYEPEPSPIRGA